MTLREPLHGAKQSGGRRLLRRLHPEKTQIIKISHGITSLKTKYLLTDSGKVIRRIPHDTVTTERRKLKVLA